MEQRRNNLEFISANVSEALLRIMCFLDGASLLEFAISSQLVFGEVQRLVETRKTELLKRRILGHSVQKIPPKRVLNYIHIRQSLFDSSQTNRRAKGSNFSGETSSVFDEKWVYLSNPVKEVPSIEDLVSKKLLSECCVFRSCVQGPSPASKGPESIPALLLLHRCLVDEKLAYRFDSVSKGTQESSNKYEMFYSSGNHGIDMVGVDINDKATLLSRQKLALKMIKEKEDQEEEKTSCSVHPPFKLKSLSRICIVLCHGGYFSVAIYNEGKPIVHKSDHKYVVRKKAGGRQSTKDKSANIKSMGSQIRRANEKKHQENVKGILASLLEELKRCQLILLYAPGFNEQILMGDDEDVLIKLRETIPVRSICLSAKRANFTENERLFKTLTKVHVFMASDPSLPS